MFSKHGVLMGATVALAMALSGCRLLDDFSPSTSESSSTASTMDASQWTFEYSPGMPGHPSTADNGWTFAFPNANGVHYLTTKSHPGSASAAISASISVETSGDPFFEYRTEPGNTCEAPATVRLYFQRRGDNMSGDG